MSRPVVSCSSRYLPRLVDQDAVVGAVGRRARRWRRGRWRGRGSRPASPSRGSAGRAVRHMRQMSPAATGCSIERLAAAIGHPHRAGRRRSRTSCRATRTPRRPAPSVRRSTRCPWSSRRRRRAPCSRRSWPGRSRVAAIRNHRLHVVQLAVGPPHLARGADRGRHRGVDDHVARHVQVGDALARIHHRQRRPRRVHRLDVGLDRALLIGRQRLDLRVDVADAVVGIDAEPCRTAPRACRRRPCSRR